MADQQPQLFAFPSRYAYPQQPKQVLEEFPVQFYLLALRSIACSQCSRAPLSGCSLSYGRSLLFCNCRSYAIEEGEEQRQVDGSRDLGSVFEVESREFGDDALDRSIWREQSDLGLRSHL